MASKKTSNQPLGVKLKKLLIASALLFSTNVYAGGFFQDIVDFFGPNCEELVPAIEKNGKWEPSHNLMFAYYADRDIAEASCRYNGTGNRRFEGTYTAYACGMQLQMCRFETHRGND